MVEMSKSNEVKIKYLSRMGKERCCSNVSSSNVITRKRDRNLKRKISLNTLYKGFSEERNRKVESL